MISVSIIWFGTIQLSLENIPTKKAGKAKGTTLSPHYVIPIFSSSAVITFGIL